MLTLGTCFQGKKSLKRRLEGQTMLKLRLQGGLL